MTNSELLREIAVLRQENSRFRQQSGMLRNQLEAFMDNSPATAWIKDSSGALIYINKRFQEYVDSGEFPAKDWQGKTDIEIWDEREAKSHREADLKVLTQGEPISDYIDIEHSDGIHHWLAHRFRFLSSDGEFCIGCLSFDLTEQVNASASMQKALGMMSQANAEKTEFLSLVSQELHNPLNSIISSADKYQEQRGAESGSELMGYINYGLARLRSQIDNLVILAETDSGETAVDDSEFDVQALVGRISKSAKGLLLANVEFSAVQEGLIPEKLIGDSYLIEHLVRPLLVNACKFTEQGRVQLTVDWDSVRENLYFKVEDSGCGIAIEQQKQIYLDALQVSKGLSRGGLAIGVGLTVFYRLVEVLNVDIVFESVAGVGTTVELSIPLEAADQAPSRVEREVISSGSILVVEPDPAQADLLATFLKRLSYDVHIVDSGEKALRYLRGNSYQLIFVESQMPVMDGITATRWMRRRGVKTPIVTVCDFTAKMERLRHINFGANDFIVKPVQRIDLFKVLERQGLMKY